MGKRYHFMFLFQGIVQKKHFFPDSTPFHGIAGRGTQYIQKIGQKAQLFRFQLLPFELLHKYMGWCFQQIRKSCAEILTACASCRSSINRFTFARVWLNCCICAVKESLLSMLKLTFRYISQHILLKFFVIYLKQFFSIRRIQFEEQHPLILKIKGLYGHVVLKRDPLVSL